MEKQIHSGLKITFLVHFVVGLVFGLMYLFFPKGWGNLVNWPVQEPFIYQVVGAAILGYATSSILAYRETNWEKVIIVVRMEIVWTVLGTLAMLWGVIFGGAPAIGWLNAIILGGFAVAFSIFYNPA
jgi:hypothetical protein